MNEWETYALILWKTPAAWVTTEVVTIIWVLLIYLSKG